MNDVLLFEVEESAAQDSKPGGCDNGQPEIIHDISNHCSHIPEVS